MGGGEAALRQTVAALEQEISRAGFVMTALDHLDVDAIRALRRRVAELPPLDRIGLEADKTPERQAAYRDRLAQQRLRLRHHQVIVAYALEKLPAGLARSLCLVAPNAAAMLSRDGIWLVASGLGFVGGLEDCVGGQDQTPHGFVAFVSQQVHQYQSARA